MRSLPRLAALPLIAMLSACGSPPSGYYDSNGNWVAPTNATTEAQRNHAPDSNMMTYHDRDYRPVEYSRAGYYDYDGNYVTVETLQDRIDVPPQSMLPPRGMCRVWIPGRLPENQPHSESCDGIQYRVPAGAYVIYGG